MFADKSLKEIVFRIVNSLMAAGILCVAGDIVLAWQGRDVSCSLFLLIFVLTTGLLFLLQSLKTKYIIKPALCLLYVLALVVCGLLFGWKLFSVNAAFRNLDQGKNQLFGCKKVMLIVPHQDDDINVLGGVMEEYIRYGSDLYPVFVTNGDHRGLAEKRFRETMDVMNYLGVPAENVFFLGYGDGWEESGPHIYNAEPGEVLKSFAGYSATYGTEAHGAYREGREYTVENYLEDLKEIILEKRPDIIFCSDYDDHIDHKAVSLAFEKVMGWIRKENPDYSPLIFKGYAYNTAWLAEADFYETNIVSTLNIFEEPYCQTPAVYRWDERIRLPVGDYTLSRSLISSRGFQTLVMYKSQKADRQGVNVINGDKVFWFRSADSLCYRADIQVSSGNGDLLNDFMLLDHANLTEKEHLPYDGTWIPEDEDKTVTVNFPISQDLAVIRVYDNPSPEDNVLGGKILFPDGSEVAFGPLDPKGAATVIPVNQSGVSGFVLSLTETEGEKAGLTELEAFSEFPEHGLRFVKVMDNMDNFIYDYWIPSGTEADLELYTSGLTREEQQNLQVNWDNRECSALLENGRLHVVCPQGATMTLTVSVAGTDLADSVRIHNPGRLERECYRIGQTLEEKVYWQYCDNICSRSATLKMLTDMLGILQ